MCVCVCVCVCVCMYMKNYREFDADMYTFAYSQSTCCCSVRFCRSIERLRSGGVLNKIYHNYKCPAIGNVRYILSFVCSLLCFLQLNSSG